jgi:CDP-diacylglycerol--glycerol-3-phosphate 3-phosphatidyltransferase
MAPSWTSAFGRACGVLLDTIVRWLALSRINPNVLTFWDWSSTPGPAILFGSANASNQQRMFFYAGLVIIFSGFFDLSMDKSPAPPTASPASSLFDSVVDRYSDASQFLGLLSSTPAADVSFTSSSPPSSWSAPSWSATPGREPKA